MQPASPDPRGAAHPTGPGALPQKVPDSPPHTRGLADVVGRPAAVPAPNLDALRASVAAYVKQARADHVPAARVVIGVKAMCRAQAQALDPTRYQAVLDGVVSWAVAAYYGEP